MDREAIKGWAQRCLKDANNSGILDGGARVSLSSSENSDDGTPRAYITIGNDGLVRIDFKENPLEETEIIPADEFLA